MYIKTHRRSKGLSQKQYGQYCIKTFDLSKFKLHMHDTHVVCYTKRGILRYLDSSRFACTSTQSDLGATLSTNLYNKITLTYQWTVYLSGQTVRMELHKLSAELNGKCR